jgi:hypothetical protein
LKLITNLYFVTALNQKAGNVKYLASNQFLVNLKVLNLRGVNLTVGEHGFSLLIYRNPCLTTIIICNLLYIKINAGFNALLSVKVFHH